MNAPQNPSWPAVAVTTSWRLSLVIKALIIGMLCLAGQAMAAAPDLTAGGVPNDSEQWNLGPTGMTGWCYREGYNTPNARQFLVKTLAAGSPAAGIMALDDVILGASGTGADPVNFSKDARIALAEAIGDAEARSPAILKILRWRAGVTTIVSLTLETLGAYSATAPYNCPKSAAILEKGIQWMMNTNANDNNWRYSALNLLAANDPTNPNNAARQAKAATDVRQLILTPAQIALFTSGKSMGSSEKPWHIGPKLIALSEYFLQTGDPDPDVIASIRAYAHCVANGQSMFGTMGHYFTNPGFRNNPVNGPYNRGYGTVTNAGLPCYIGLTLAKKCGLNDPEILAGIARAGTYFSHQTHLGCAGYGEQGPYLKHDDNGKAGLQALAFQFEGDRLESTKYFARSSTAGAIADRDTGHTGSFFAYLYSPLGANVGGPDAMAYYFRETKWMYELARRWDGSFVYNSFSGGNVEINALSGQGGCLMATPMLLTYAMPLRQTYLTGKNQNPANWITPAEMPEVSAASAHIYNPASRTTEELLVDIGSWSPKQRATAAKELDLRPAEYATLLPILHAMATNESADFLARSGACQALGLIGDTSSVPVLLPLATHSNFAIRYHASLAIRVMPVAANIPHINAIMQACITNMRPVLPIDPEDPIQLVNENLCGALFPPYAALYSHNLVGIDRELLYGAMRACASSPLSATRVSLSLIYPKLTPVDIDKVADVFVTIGYENAVSGPDTSSSRLPALILLQSKGKAEGVPLAIRLIEDENGEAAQSLNLLASYAGSSNTVTPNPDVEQFCEILIATGAGYGIPEARAVLAAINADTSPDVLTAFKSIEWVIPDHATFNLPKKSTVLRVHSTNLSNPTSFYTWRKLRGAGAVSFSPNGTSAAKDATVVFDGIPGEYLFEVTMSDSHGLTEVSKTVAVTLRNSGGNLPTNSPPTANGQSLTVAQGAPTQVILTGSDPEGYALTYTVTTGPANGFVSGTAPHLVYTAVANYTGADSIAFEVQDSEGQVATATVSITVNAGAPVGLAIYEPFNYAAGELHGKSGASEIGLTGTWTAGSSMTTESPSLTYGTLPTSGNRVRSVNVTRYGNPGGSRPISSSALAGRGLLDNGSTLWFSVVMGGYGGYLNGGNDIDLALGNNNLLTGPNIPNDGSQPGSGLGVRLDSTGVSAAQYYDPAVGAPLIGAYDNTAAGGILNENQRLVVGKITWGATADTIEIYLPGQDMILPAPTSVLTANVDQSTFDTLTFSRGLNVLLDEIRYGATLQSVLQGTVAMTPDVTAPTPNPMTFAVAPAPDSISSITMTATPALDGMGVEYLFTCTAGGGDSSGWQTSNAYTDSGLTPGVAYSYTVKARDLYPALNETTTSAAASATIPALGTVPGVEGLAQAFATSQITNASLTLGTVTMSGSYSMTVPAGHVLSQSPADGASAAYGSAVNLVISIGQNPVLPVLTPVNIVDNKNGEQIELGTPVTYTLTFNKDIDAATLDAADFTNIGDAPITIGTITEISPGIVTVYVTPTGFASGILRFAVAAGALIQDTLGNDLNTASAIIDDTVISIVPIQPKTQTFTGNYSSSDNWNTATNWNINSGPVPSGADSVIIPAGKFVITTTDATPLYSGNLTLGIGTQLRTGVDNSNILVNAFECLGTPGSTTISMAQGSKIALRHNVSVIMPAIVLQGDAEIEMGVFGSGFALGTDPVFNYPITGPYQLMFTGKNDCFATLNVANNFGHLLLSPRNSAGFTVTANAAGALGGDVTVEADPGSGAKGANLIFAAANAMADTATLSLYGNTGSFVTVNANDTIGGLKLNGVKQLPGTYNSGNSTWLAGTGTLTVAGETMAYWNPSGGPSGNWDDSNIWNTQADLAGIDNAWTPGQIAAFNAAGTYGVTLSGTREIGGLVVSNGTITLSGGGLSLFKDAPVNIASGASLSIDTVIEQSSLGLGLHKSGAGTLNLLAENTFTGPVAIGAGTLTIATIDNAGAPSALGQYPDAGIGGLTLAGGTLRYTGGNANVNRGFTFTGSSTIDINNPGSSLTLANVETAGSGTLTATGGAGSSLGLGHIRMVQNTITLNPTITTMSVASVEAYSSSPFKPSLTLGGSSTGNVVTGNIFATAYPGDSSAAGIHVVKNGTSDWKIAGVLSSVGGNYAPRVSVTVNQGTLTLAGSNTYTGITNLNNDAKLVLDFAATDTSKIGGNFAIGGGTLELKGGAHIEVVSSTTLNVGPTSYITRNGGTAKLRMNAITRGAGSTIIFLDGTVADTDRVNTNGILGGYATVGGDWAVNSTNGADGSITPLSTYETIPASGGSAIANYLLSGSGTLTGALVANSLKIANTDVNQTFDMGSNTLTVTTTSATALGGVLYAGGGNNTYTINGTGALLASSTTGELVIHSHVGALTVNAPVVTSGATAGLLTKSGSGSLILGGTNVYTGTTRVASGKLFVNGSLSSQTASLIVDPGATLGGSGTVGRNIAIANNGKLEFTLGTPAASHVPLTRSSGRTMGFSGSSILTITAGANAAPGLYTLITGGNNITGSAPATVILPPGWTADPPTISTNLLRINITNVVAPPANVAPVWAINPVNVADATEDANYSATIANDATDSNNDMLTFMKVSGPSWLNIATDGTLSGTPTNSDVGANTFTVSVADGIAPAVQATLNITVTNTNDAPVWSNNPLVGPNATEDAPYSQNLATEALDVDPGSVLTFSKVSGPSWLSVAANGVISGTPSNAEVGLNVFTVSVSDGIAAPVEATLQITVINTNDAPFWTIDPIAGGAIVRDIPYTGSLVGSAADVDPGVSLVFSKVVGPAWMIVALNGTLSGTPATGDIGVNSFTVAVSDGIAPPVTATFVLNVINGNLAPVAQAQSVSTDEDTNLPVTLTATDGDNNPLTYFVVTQPTKGTLSGTPPNLTYTPDLNQNGADSFTFKVNDSVVDSGIATISITINSINDDPVFTANPIVLAIGIETIDYTGQTLASKATDVDAGDTLTYSKISGPAWLFVASNGAITGVPPVGSAGLNSFVVRATDSASATVDATLEITVVIDALIWDANSFASGQTNGAGAWLGNNLWYDPNALPAPLNLNWISGSNAIFGGQNTAGGAVTLASPTTANIIQFNAFTGTYTLGTSGQALTINGGIDKTSASAIVNIISPIVLGGSQTWTNNSTSALTASSTFDNGGFTLTAGGTGTTTLSGVISGAGGFVKNGPGVLSFGTLSNANTYTGPTTINGGVLSVANNSASLGSGNLTINSGILAFSANISFPARTLGTGSNQVQIPGGVSGFGGNSSSAPTINLGTSIVWGASGQGSATGYFNPSKFVLGSAIASAGGTTFSSGIDLNGTARTITVPFGVHATSPNFATLSGIISNSTGTAGLIKEGGGSLNLNGINTYNGGTTLLAGTIQLGNVAGLGATSAPLTINGGLLNLNGQTNVTVGNLTGAGGMIANNVSSGRVLIIGSGNGSGGNYQGVIVDKTTGTGTIALTKTGTGTITLSGPNTYTGLTTISAGTLFINGDQSTATGNLSVAANATLGGTGIIGGNITIAATGKLEFNLSTNAGSHNPLDLAAGKALTFSGASTLTITSVGGASPGLYTLITGGNNITGVAPATLNLPVGWVATVSISGNSLLLNVVSTGDFTAGNLAVAAAGGLSFSGYVGGPFSPSSLVYTLSNPGQTTIDWTATKTTAWVALSPASGTLAAGASATVTVSINANANPLGVGSYNDTVTFTNTTNGTGNTSRSVALTANSLPTYAVSYNGNGSTGGTAPSNQTKIQGTNLTLSGPGTLIRAGYTFSHWNTATDDSGISYAAGATYSTDAAVVLYAQWTASSYTVTFNANGGVAPIPTVKSVTYSSAYGTLATTSRTGYSFNGWFTAASGGSEVTSATTVAITAGQTLYAQWTANAYTITFDSNGGSSVTAITQDFGSTVTAPAAPTRTGYTFVAWSPALPSTMPANNLTLTAQWTANTYTVTFDANGGDAPTPASITATYDAAYGTLATTARAGFIFGDWFTAAVGGTQVTSGTMVTIGENHTLYAQWIQYLPEMDVTRSGNPIVSGGFDAITGTTAGTATPLTFVIANSSSVSLTLGTVTQSGASNCSVAITQPSGSVAPFGTTNLDLTVTPTAAGAWSFAVSIPNDDANENPYRWTIYGVAQQTTTASFTASADTYLNGASGTTGTNYGSATTIALNKRSNQNRRGLINFNLPTDQSVSTVSSAVMKFFAAGGQTGTVEIFDTLNSWNAATATFTNSDSVIGTTSYGSATIATATLGTAVPDITLNASARTLIKDWFNPTTAKNGFSIKTNYTNNSSNSVTVCSTDHATTTYRPKLNLTYTYSPLAPEMHVTRAGSLVADGGTDTVSGTLAATGAQLTYTIANLGSANLTLTTPVSLVVGSNCSVAVDAEPTSPLTASATGNLLVTVTPTAPGPWSATLSITNNDANEAPYNWTINGTATGSYTVTLEKQGGSGGSDSVVTTIASAMPSAVAPTRAGHTFGGYYTQTSGGGTQYYTSSMASSRNWDLSANTTLYAQWTINPYTITFDSNGGSAVTAITQNFGTAVTAPAAPTRTGYTFAAWSPVIPSTIPTNNLIVTAQWTANTYTVTFDANGGDASTPTSTPVTYGSTYGALATVSRTGYAFNGWFTSTSGGTLVTSASTVAITAAQTLYAQWTINPYTITFDSNGGSAVTAITQNFGTTITAPAAPTRTGYTFAAWSPALPSTIPANNQTVTAQWIANTYTVTFDTNGGDAPSLASKSVTYGSTYGALATVTRTGYAFNGWFTSTSGGTLVTNASTVAITAAQTLFARWTANTYTVTFDANGGDAPTPTSLSVTYGSTYGILATSSRTGYAFNGWFTSASGGTQVTNTSTVAITAAQTLHAQWTANTYTVTFDANGGLAATPASLSVTYDSTYGTLATVSRTGYTFNGWFTSVSGGTQVTSASTVTITAAQTLFAQWTNNAPTWVSNPITGVNATEDSVYSATLVGSASDVDAGASLTFAKVSGPTWLSVAANGALSGTPNNSNVGMNSFTVSVSDGIASAVQATLNITVTNTNDAPTWTSNPITGTNATEDSAYSATLAGGASDIDAGASLTFAKVSGPAWLSVAPNGALSGTPTNSNVGANSFTVSVSDGIATAVTATLNITVTNTNDAPTWTSDPITGTNATEDSVYSATLTGSASDVDAGASLTFAKVSGPAWLSVAANGALSGTPTNSDVGANSFTVSVSDGIATAVTATLNITVINTNDAPTWTSNPITGTSATEDSAYSATLAGSASDVDAGASLTFAKVSGPAWLSVATNGALSGTPTNSDVGANSFTVSVSDGIAPAVQTTLNIIVNFPALIWDTDAAGNWTDITKWLGDAAYASGTNSTANFGDFITANRIITLDAPITIGNITASDTTHNYTIAGSGANILTLDRSSGIPTLDVTSGRTLTISSQIAGLDGLQKIGLGTLTLTSANSYTGDTTITGSTLNLGGATASGSLASTVLNLAGGTLSYTRTGSTTQNFTTTNIKLGASTASTVAGNTLNLGDLTRDVGGTLNFGSVGSIITSEANNGSGIIGGWATFNNANWAVANGTSAITGAPTYYTTVTGGTTGSNYTNVRNMDVSASVAMDATINPNTVRFNVAGISTVTLAAGDNIIASGGILVTSTVGNNASTITGGNLAGSSGGDLIIHQHNTSSTLTIGSIIKDNGGATGLTKSGAGTLTLNGDNSYTGITTINAGTVLISHANALGTSAGNTTIAATGSTATGGQLQLTGGITTAENITITGSTELSGLAAAISGAANTTNTLSGNITLSNLTGGVRIASGNAGAKLNFTGTISQTGSSQALVFALNNAGGQTVTVNNPIALNGGALILNGNGSNVILKGVNATDGSGIGTTTINSGGVGLQLGISNAINTTATLTNNGNFDLANFNQTVNALAGASTGIVKNTVAGTKTLTVGNGGGSGTFSGVIQTSTGQVTLVKTGIGTQTLNGTNTSTGGTRIDAGTLTLGHATNTLADTGAVNVNGGTLDLGTNTDTVGAVTLTSGSITSSSGILTGSSYAVESGIVSAILSGAGVGLTKTTAGTVTLSGDNTYTGATNVNDGTLRVNGNQSTASGNVSVAANATLGGTGTLGGTTTIAASGKLEFNLSTNAASHNSLELVVGKALTFADISTLTITSSGGAIPGTYTLITGGNNITGVAPATVILPPGWTADAPTISGNSLLLNVTATGPTYTVNYNTNSATSGTAPSNQTKNHDVNLTLATNTGGLARTGYTFVGWNTQSDGLGTDYAVAATYTANATVILYAKWITAFDTWSGGSSFGTDSNGDGTHNGMAWLLGAINKDTNAASTLPVASSNAGNLQLNFTCLNVANRGSATLKLQVSDDLGITDPWTNQEAVVPDTGGTVNGILFTISENADPNLINVQASIPGSGGKVFARLMGAP